MAYGDRLVIYSRATGMFFAGRDNYRQVYAREAVGEWTHDLAMAYRSRNLAYMHRMVDALGGDAQILSETRARQIALMELARMVRT